jgi:hypothetical protein
MLPILPVLILLMFQGPATSERLALHGYLPEALHAIHQRLEAQPDRESEVLSELIAASQDPQLTQALIAMLRLVDARQPANEPLPVEPWKFVPIDSPEPPPPIDGYQTCRRSRDGPF